MENSGREIAKESTRVADVMTRNVVTLRPEQTFAETVNLMSKHSFRHFPVIEPPARLVGVISDRDILRGVARIKDWNTSYVHQFMSRDVVAVKPDTKLSHATGTMLSKRINCLPVIDDNGVVCGIITTTDLLKVFRSIQESLEQDTP
ncbi:MAG TPA: CBS domain-containing protein [Candidatus Binatia bacterium]|nr:CBS domain-containing protein [Candidatus Binatia bacterium]